ncbi:MAG: hypothetical protein EKK55_12935 [Rhodocyclaceae bacterium]|nr:MAG: hypothetical protein EKK55_12935 [Rhodocyclaceae bacterium]
MKLEDLFKAPEDSTPVARVALVGTAGAGKTYLSLLMGSALAQGKPIVVIDSEHGSAAKYRHLAPFRVAAPADFAKLVTNPGKLPAVEHDPRLYTAGIIAAGKAGAGVIIVDSLSHAWQATKSHVDAIVANTRAGNSFTAWKDVTPLWDALMSAIMSSPAHVIVTIRAKPAYVLEEREGHGGRVKSVPVKVGMAPEVRDGADHAFDIVLNIDDEHRVTVTKTRMSALDGRVMLKPGNELGAEVLAWLGSGDVATARLTDERVIDVTPAEGDSGPADDAPLVARARRLAADLPGGWGALNAYAKAKAGTEFDAFMGGLPSFDAQAGVLLALEERAAKIGEGSWLTAFRTTIGTGHVKAARSAMGKLGLDQSMKAEDIPTASLTGLTLYVMGL